MSTTIGALNVKVSASSAGVAETMNATAAAVQSCGKQVASTQAAINASGGGSSKAARGFQELARGAEDAAAVYGTTGLAGALRASSNNLSQFASIISPAAGAVTGFAIAIGSVLIPKLFDTSKAAEKLKRDIEGIDAQFRAIEGTIKAADALRGFGREVAKMFDPTDVGNKAAKIRAEIEDTDAKIGDIAKARAGMEKQIVRAPNKNEFKAGLGLGFGEAEISNEEKKRNAARRENINKLSEEIIKERERKEELEKQLELVTRQGKAASERAAALDQIKMQNEAARQNSESIKESNKRLEAARQIEADILSELDEEAAKRRKIIDLERDRQKAIQKAPISQAEKDQLSIGAANSRNRQLGMLDVPAMNEAKSLLQMQIDRLKQARGITPVQDALQRGSAGAVSFVNRTSAKPVKDPQLDALQKQLEKLNRVIADRLGKPIELVQGYL